MKRAIRDFLFAIAAIFLYIVFFLSCICYSFYAAYELAKDTLRYG